MICCQCGKDFKEMGAGIHQHLKKCYKGIECDNPYIYNALIRYNFLTYDFLYHQYIELKRSPKAISLEFLNSEDNICNKSGGCIGRNVIDRLLDYYNIPRRNIKEAYTCEESKTQRDNTNLKRYGHINPLGGNTPCRKQAVETIKEKYGVENVFQIKDFEHYFNIDETYIKKYGVTKSEFRSQVNKSWYHSLSKEEQWEFLKKSILSSTPVSKLETEIANCLIEHGVAIETQFELPNLYKKYKSSHNHWYFDIRIKNTNVLIEVNGDYWHGNPEKYLPTDINSTTGLTYQQIWEKDENKKENAEKQGYKVVYLWEKDIHNNENNLVEFILEEIKKQGDVLNENFAYQINSET